MADKESRAQQMQEQNERIQATLSQIKHKIVIFSGKGGVGKTTVAVNLAYALIAVGVILSAPFSRRGLFVQAAIAIVLVGATEGAGMALNNLAAKLPIVAPFQYLTAILPILLGLGLLIRRPRLRPRGGATAPAGTPA